MRRDDEPPAFRYSMITHAQSRLARIRRSTSTSISLSLCAPCCRWWKGGVCILSHRRDSGWHLDCFKFEKQVVTLAWVPSPRSFFNRGGRVEMDKFHTRSRYRSVQNEAFHSHAISATWRSTLAFYVPCPYSFALHYCELHLTCITSLAGWYRAGNAAGALLENWHCWYCCILEVK